MINGLVILTQIRGNRETLGRAEIEAIVEQAVDIFIRLLQAGPASSDCE